MNGQMLAAKYTFPSRITGPPRAGQAETRRRFPRAFRDEGAPLKDHSSFPSAALTQYKYPSSLVKYTRPCQHTGGSRTGQPVKKLHTSAPEFKSSAITLSQSLKPMNIWLPRTTGSKTWSYGMRS